MKSMRIKVENKGSISPETMIHTYLCTISIVLCSLLFTSNNFIDFPGFYLFYFQVRSFLHCGRSGTNLANLYCNYLPCARNNYT